MNNLDTLKIRSQLSKRLYDASIRMRAPPWVDVQDVHPNNDSSMPPTSRRNYIVLTSTNQMYVAQYGYLSHNVWVSAAGIILIPEYDYDIISWCPLPESSSGISQEPNTAKESDAM